MLHHLHYDNGQHMIWGAAELNNINSFPLILIVDQAKKKKKKKKKYEKVISVYFCINFKYISITKITICYTYLPT